MKVNMTPNPLDVVTIHASQGDTEARQWEFELHNNGELIDTSGVTDQMVFKAYKGGTEQILPENGSTPTTSPFKGDIKYPQGLLSDQEFLYRESPTEEDGLAKITDIKGNTLVWNQLAHELTSDHYGATYSGDVVSFNDGIVSMTANHQYGGFGPLSNSRFSIVSDHKYLVCLSFKPTTTNTLFRYNYTLASSNIVGNLYTNTANVWNTSAIIHTARATGQSGLLFQDARTSGWDEIQVKNLQVFDLTQMGLDSITSVDEFKALFPLPFYQFEQGKLLSFNGNGIKTVSKNQFDTQVVTTSYAGLTLTKTQGTIRAVYSGSSRYAGFNFYGSPVFTDTFLKGRYRLSFDVSGLDTQWTVGLRQGASYVGTQAVVISNDGHYSFTIDAEANPNCYLSFARTGNKTTAYDVTFSNIQLELGTTETSYTPFEEQTISLPISTYFPTGMKSAGSVYDELTSAKAITRIGAVDLGSLTWQYYSARNNFYAVIPDIAVPTNANTKTNAKCILGVPITWNEMLANQNESGTYAVTQVDTEKRFYIKNTNYSSVTDFMTFINGVYLYYELATPTETSFTTASLVTENAEIPLSNEDGVLIGKCTEELSAEPGFHDAKIKLTDSDGTCYSNKLQLHVERSPQ